MRVVISNSSPVTVNGLYCKSGSLTVKAFGRRSLMAVASPFLMRGDRLLANPRVQRHWSREARAGRLHGSRKLLVLERWERGVIRHAIDEAAAVRDGRAADDVPEPPLNIDDVEELFLQQGGVLDDDCEVLVLPEVDSPELSEASDDDGGAGDGGAGAGGGTGDVEMAADEDGGATGAADVEMAHGDGGATGAAGSDAEMAGGAASNVDANGGGVSKTGGGRSRASGLAPHERGAVVEERTRGRRAAAAVSAPDDEDGRN